MDISILILTFNEEKHIARCIKSLQIFTQNIYIVDSFSTDKTVEIAKSLGVVVYQNPWINYSKQFNWGLENCNINTKWIMRMDADEYVLPELAHEIKEKLNTLDLNTTGIYVKRRNYFMDKWIKHGNSYPIWLLRIWVYKKGYCEERWMDEHIKVTEGITIKFKEDIVDHNLHNLTAWINKHNGYATREAADYFNSHLNYLIQDDITPNFWGSQAQRKRWLKVKYNQLPLFIRPCIYFIYVYLFRLGFLDGKKGFLIHFLQAFWYRFLVDAKINEINYKTAKDKDKILIFFKNEYGIDLLK